MAKAGETVKHCAGCKVDSVHVFASSAGSIPTFISTTSSSPDVTPSSSAPSHRAPHLHIHHGRHVVTSHSFQEHLFCTHYVHGQVRGPLEIAPAQGPTHWEWPVSLTSLKP